MIICRIYSLYGDKNLGDIISIFLQNDESLITYTLDSLYIEKITFFNELIINSLIMLISKPDEDPFFYGHCSQSQEILIQLINYLDDNNEIINYLINIISNLNDNGHILRILYCFINFIEDNEEYLNFINNNLFNEFKGDALVCLSNLITYKPIYANYYLNLILENLFNENFYIKKNVILLLDLISKQEIEININNIEILIYFFQNFQDDYSYFILDIITLFLTKLNNFNYDIILDFFWDLYNQFFNIQNFDSYFFSLCNFFSKFLLLFKNILINNYLIQFINKIEFFLNFNDIEILNSIFLIINTLIINNFEIIQNHNIFNKILNIIYENIQKFDNPLFEEIFWLLLNEIILKNNLILLNNFNIIINYCLSHFSLTYLNISKIIFKI